METPNTQNESLANDLGSKPSGGETHAPWYSTLGSLHTLGLLALLVTAFYICLSTPANGWRDGPEFSVTATYLDVAHPSGFPTYNLLAKIATWLPLGSLGFRVTIFTALAGGLSLLLMALLLIRLHALEKEAPTALPWLLAPILVFALDKAVFVSSTELEVYSLHTVFVVLLIYCATRWHEGSGIKWLYVGGFLYGLSAGNHGSMCLYLPVLLLLTFFGEPTSENNGKGTRHLVRLGFLILFFLIGLSVYLFLIIRSNTDNLPVDFGHPNTWQRLWYHVSDAKDADYHFKGILNQEEFFYLARIQLNNLVSPVFWPSLPFFAWGLRYLWRNFQILSVAAVLLILINLGFFYYWVDGSSAFIPSICVYTLVTALGLGELGRFLRGRKIIRPLVCAAMALVTAVALVSMGRARISERDTLSGYQSVELFFPDLSHVPPDSLVIHHSAWLSLLSLQYVYGARPDIPLVLMAGLYEPRFMTYPRPESMPLAHFPKDQNGNLVSPFVEGYANYFFNANMEKGKRIFMHYGKEIEPYLPYIEPATEFMWMGELKQDVSAGLDAIDDGSYEALLKRHQEYFEAMHADPEQPVAPKAASYLFYIDRTILEYTYINRMYDITAETIKKYIDLFAFKDGKPAIPNDILLNSLALYANSCKHQGKFAEAEKAAATLMEIRPNYDLTYLLLGMLYDTQNKGQETLDAYRRATELNAYSRIAAIRYATALAKYRTINDATAFLDGYIAFLDKEGLDNSKRMLSYQRDCLLLEPSKPELPEGNLMLKLFYEGVPNEANTDM